LERVGKRAEAAVVLGHQLSHFRVNDRWNQDISGSPNLSELMISQGFRLPKSLTSVKIKLTFRTIRA